MESEEGRAQNDCHDDTPAFHAAQCSNSALYICSVFPCRAVLSDPLLLIPQRPRHPRPGKSVRMDERSRVDAQMVAHSHHA
jgi:hypothetical protein